MTLVLAAHYDAPRRGLAFRPGLRRLGARLQRAARGRLPGPLAWPVLAALAVVAAAAARAAGAEGDALGAAQLVPTVVLLATVALAIDVALAGAAPGASDPGSAAALALALWDDLRAAAPRHLAPELVLAGAGSDEPAGFAAHLGRRGRRRYDGARTIVVALAPCGHGQPRWFAREGVLLARAAHPRLRAAAARAAAAAPAQPHGWRGPGEAQAARRAGLPAITVGCLDPGGWLPAARHPDDTADALDAAALGAARAYARALIAELDREVGAAPPPPPA